MTGLPTIVPTAGFEFVTDTFTVNPGRRSCVVTQRRFNGLRSAASTLMDVFAARVLVEKLLAFRTNPDGWIVTVLVSVT